MNSLELSWQQIYSYWKSSINQYCHHSFIDIFTEVKVKPHSNPNIQVGDGVIDWWPTNEIERRKNNLNDKGILGVYWETVTGYLRTAEMLWDNREVEEQLALIWILAGLKEITSNLPVEWRGDSYRFISDVMRVVNNELRERNMWSWHSSTKNFLPVTVHKQLELYSRPMDLYNLIEIISIDNTLSRNSWTLVKVTREEDSFG